MNRLSRIYSSSLLISIFIFSATQSTAAELHELRAELDRDFHQQLKKTADKCDQLKLVGQAKITRAWFIPRDPQRQYLFLPSESDPVKPPKHAGKYIASWYKRFSEQRRSQAAKLFKLSRDRLEENHANDAYQLLHEVLHEDPNHTEARLLLGYRKVNGRWQKIAAHPKVKKKHYAHPHFGWKSGKHWVADSEHFRISSNLGAKETLDAAREMETLHDVWRQSFVGYWINTNTLKQHFKELTPISTATKNRKKHSVTLFRNRGEYIARLKPKNPRIELSQGIYLDGDNATYIYAGDPAAKAIWYHEATHQLFHEADRVVAAVGSQQNIWAIEGVALYMESLVNHVGYSTVGGADADRLQFARFRALNDEFYLPLEKLVQLNRDTLQRHKDVRPLYSQAAGLMHFFITHQRGKYRDAIGEYLQLVYQGHDTKESLAQLTGKTLAKLDTEYHKSLKLTDADLEHLNPPAYVRNLSLGNSPVTDHGLKNLILCSELQWLDLSYTKVTDAGLTNISQLKNLKTLSLTGLQVTDEGLLHLKELKQLETLDLRQTKVTPAGIERLRKSLPKLKQVEQ